MLTEVVKSAEGRTDVDNVVLDQASQHPPPSDFPVEKINDQTQEQVHQYAPPASFYDPSQQHNQAQAPYFPPPPNSDEKAPAYPPRPVSQGNSQYSTSTSHTQAQAPYYPPPPGAPPVYSSGSGTSGHDQVLESGGPPTHDQKESYGPRYS